MSMLEQPTDSARTEGTITGRLDDLPPSTVPRPKVEIIHRDFNRGLFDLHDPLENIGYNLSQFDVSSSFPLAREEVDKVVADLYEATTFKVHYGSIPEATVKLIDFNDVKTGNREPPRRFVVIERETTRNTRTSIYATFLKYGDNLYVGVDAFILGPLNLVSFIISLLIGFAPLLFIFYSRSSAGFCLIIPAILFAAFWFRKAIFNMMRGDPLDIAIRKAYNKVGNLGTFNVADILMFYQSVLPMILRCMIEVFQKHDIPTDVLEGYVQKINYVTNINSTEINNSGGVMNMVNSAVGAANRVASGASPLK